MKKRVRLTFLLVLNLLMLAVFALHGCARTTLRFHVNNTSSLQAMEGDLDFAKSQVEGTDEALDELKVSPREDLKTAYSAFSESVEKMEMAGRRLVRHADGMREVGGDYLVASEMSATECRFPRLSETAGTQPLQLGDAFRPIYESSKTLRHVFRAYYFDVSTIREQLSRNLTPNGIESVEMLFRKAKVDSESLSMALNETRAAVRDAKKAQPTAAPVGISQSAPGGAVSAPPETVPPSPPESVPPSPPESVPPSPPESVPPSPPESSP